MAVSPDGRLILTTGSDHTARLWDATTGDMVHLLIGHTDLVVGASPGIEAQCMAHHSRWITATF